MCARTTDRPALLPGSDEEPGEQTCKPVVVTATRGEERKVSSGIQVLVGLGQEMDGRKKAEEEVTANGIRS